MAAAPDQAPADGDQLSPSKRFGSSIHTLGRGSLGRINRKYPSLNVVSRGAAATEGGGKEGEPVEEDSAKNTPEDAETGGSAHEATSAGQENGGNIERGGNSFNALMSKWGGKSKGKKRSPKEDEGPNATTAGDGPAPLPRTPKSPKVEMKWNSNTMAYEAVVVDADEVAPAISNEATPASSPKDGAPKPSPGKAKVPSFLKAKSKPADGEVGVPSAENGEKAPSPTARFSASVKSANVPSFLQTKSKQAQEPEVEPEGVPKPATGEVPTPTSQPDKADAGNGTPSSSLGRVQQMSAFLKAPSFPKAKSKQETSKESGEPEPLPGASNNESVPSSIQYSNEAKDAGGPKKTKGASAKQNKAKPKQPPQPQGRNRSSKSDSSNGHNSKQSTKRNNLVQPKSRQQLVLEKVAARYLLKNGQTNARYAGVKDYGDGDIGVLGDIDENAVGASRLHSMARTSAPLGLNKAFPNRDREALVSFLEGKNRRKSSEDGSTDEDPKNLSIITEVSSSSDGSGSKKSAQPPDIQKETDIDRILEVASDHLSLGQNNLALQAYRRAMKCAFADVLSVKQKLTEVKQRQANDGLDGTELELTRKEERQFGLDLLRVASRVADIHNNMGVVHEMERQFEKARSSYVDALEVYHNTCQRFEEKGDPDVDRTKMNVERMTLACNSDEKRKALHEKASRAAKRGQVADFSQRTKCLHEAIATLNKALELEGETIGLTHPVAAQTLVKIAKYHYEIREFDAAVSEIRRAITILRNALGGNHPQVGKSTLLLASIYERHGTDISPEGTKKEDSQLELYVDALEPLKATLGETHGEVGLLYVKIGYLYGKKGDRNLSLLAYKAALKAFGEPSSAATGESGVNPEVVSIWVRVTEHLNALNAWDDVVVAGRRALFLLRRTKQTLVQGGSSKKSPIQITADTYDEALITTLQCLGQAHTSRSEFSLARDALSESLQLAWEMALSTNSSSKEEGRSKSIVQLIRALKRLGKSYLLEKHYNPALECFLPSLELLRSSEKMESTLDCASVLGSLGFLYLKLTRFPEASNFLKECLRLYEKNGVSANDRETRKIKSWLEMAEAREEDDGALPPSFLEIPTIVVTE